MRVRSSLPSHIEARFLAFPFVTCSCGLSGYESAVVICECFIAENMALVRTAPTIMLFCSECLRAPVDRLPCM